MDLAGGGTANNSILAVAAILTGQMEGIVLAVLPAVCLAADAVTKALLGRTWGRYGADTARCGLIVLFPCMVASFISAPGGVAVMRALMAVLIFLLHYLCYWGLLKVAFAQKGWVVSHKGWLQAVGGGAVFYSAVLFAVGYLRSGNT